MLKAYEKPVVTRVNLIPAEAVLGYCKDIGGWVSGPGQNTCCEDWLGSGGDSQCNVPAS